MKKKKTYAEQLRERVEPWKIYHNIEDIKPEPFDMKEYQKAAEKAAKTFTDEELRARGFPR
jgi:predicted RNA methylase